MRGHLNDNGVWQIGIFSLFSSWNREEKGGTDCLNKIPVDKGFHPMIRYRVRARWFHHFLGRAYALWKGD
jgi:hypothetical protein